MVSGGIVIVMGQLVAARTGSAIFYPKRRSAIAPLGPSRHIASLKSGIISQIPGHASGPRYRLPPVPGDEQHVKQIIRIAVVAFFGVLHPIPARIHPSLVGRV
ncbi:hypothetical protein D3C77_570610 [compost metagenome]